MNVNFTEIYNSMGISFFEGITSITAGLLTIVTIAYNVYNRFFLISFSNERKIQKYILYEYEHFFLRYQLITAFINPILSFLFFYLSIIFISFIKIKSSIIFQLILAIEIYFICILGLWAFETRIHNKYKSRLSIISTSISKDALEYMTKGRNKKRYLYISFLINYYLVWIVISFISLKFTNTDVIIGRIIKFEVYIYSGFLLLSLYKIFVYKINCCIKSMSVIKLDYRKEYGCYCNIVLKKDFSFKIQDNNVVIYYPGDISSYKIKQDNLISANIGYKIEYAGINKK